MSTVFRHCRHCRVWHDVKLTKCPACGEAMKLDSPCPELRQAKS